MLSIKRHTGEKKKKKKKKNFDHVTISPNPLSILLYLISNFLALVSVQHRVDQRDLQRVRHLHLRDSDRPDLNHASRIQARFQDLHRYWIHSHSRRFLHFSSKLIIFC
jgi:hypothetical protein